MKELDSYLREALGVKIPEGYAAFMEKYGDKLPEDPLTQKSWLCGLGNREFVVGTTQAFRARASGFTSQHLIIGWLGLKTIVINRSYEQIDSYVMLDARDGKILSVDFLGVGQLLAPDFDQWIGPELLRAILKDRYEAILTVIAFDSEQKAQQARENLAKLQARGFIDLEDMVVVIKERNGEVHLRQEHKLVTKGGLAGSITGLIVGSLFFAPLLGAFLGAIAGALSVSLADIGIDDEFIKDLSRKFRPGCSALFTLVRKADPQRVTEAFLGFGGKVLLSSFSKEREAQIQRVLDAATEKKAD
ncbi:MAG: DUF1269 domain-containing protein [Syntrophobacteraceae bacterium]